MAQGLRGAGRDEDLRRLGADPERRTASVASRFVEKWYRDIKVYDIFEGTAQIQRVVISKRILREQPSF